MVVFSSGLGLVVLSLIAISAAPPRAASAAAAARPNITPERLYQPGWRGAGSAGATAGAAGALGGPWPYSAL